MQRLRPLRRRITRSWRKRREFSLPGIFGRLTALVLKWVITATGLGLAPILVSPGFRESGFDVAHIASAIDTKNIDPGSLAAVAGLLVFLDELRIYFQKTPVVTEESIDSLVRNLYSAAIEEVYNCDGLHPDPIKSLLQRIENAVVAIIGEEAARSAVSSNLMVFEEQSESPHKLTLKRWGNMLPDRVVISLDVDHGLPGAPAAFIRRKVMYVDDTQSAKFKAFFEGKAYRSIVSIPVARLSQDRSLCGIVNIDSNRANLFRSEEFIEEELIPRLKPFINLIAAQWDRV